MVERPVTVLNAHHPEDMAALFAHDYGSVRPVHPARRFCGREQVRATWTAGFAGVPDFAADLAATCVNGATEWAEWDRHGRHTDGTAFAMRGVTILTVRDGLIADMRLYLEPVEASGSDIDDAVQSLYRPPAE